MNTTTSLKVNTASQKQDLCPDHIQEHHWTELLKSGIEPEIIAANFKSLFDEAGYDYLCYSAQLERTNSGRLVSRLIRQYSHTELGGWWCNGLDPLDDWKPMLWGCFKPDRPRINFEKRKVIKYEHPPQIKTRAFFLKIPYRIGLEIAIRCGVLPYDETTLCFSNKHEFWQWVLEHPQIPILLVEGAKKAACLLSNGYVAIAIPGITGGVRTRDKQGNKIQPHLIPELQEFATPGRTVYICFDHDRKRSTVEAVTKEIGKLGRLFEQAGCQVKVIDLPGPEKGVDDFIVAHGRTAFAALYKAAASFELWKAWNLCRLTHPTDLVLNQRYLGELSIPDEAKVIGIKSPKGTGKTESLITLVQEAIATGRWVLIIGHRVQLVQELCNRLGLNHVTEIRASETGATLGFGLCIDSLHPNSQARFNADGWSNGLVILDEAEQVTWHTLASNTCTGNRVAILGQLRQLLKNVLSSPKGRVVLSDADLSDCSIDFVCGLAEASIKPWICINTWKPATSWNIYHYAQTTPTHWFAALENEVEGGGRLFVCLSAQKIKGLWSTRNIEAKLRRRFPKKRILCIDSETVADKNHEAFGCITRLNEVLQQYDIVIASPSIETGVSIDIKGHFTSVWGCFQGVQSDASVRQALARLRDGVPRHIWVAKRGLSTIGNGETSVKSLLVTHDKLTRANIHLLGDADLESIDTDFDRVALMTWAKMTCRVNAGMASYRRAVLLGLLGEGHDVTEVEADADLTELKEELERQRDENRQVEAEVKCAAELITEIQYGKLKKQRAHTQEELRQIARFELEKRYGIEPTPELVIKNDDGWYPKIKLHYYLTIGRKYLKERDQRKVRELIHEGKVWAPDTNRAQISTAIAGLEGLSVLTLLNPEREYRGTDKDLAILAEFAKTTAQQIKTVLGITIKSTDSPIAIVQKLLGKLGLKLTCVGRDREEGRAAGRVYRFVPPNDSREEVFTSWLERDAGPDPEAVAVPHSERIEIEESDPGSVIKYLYNPPLDHIISLSLDRNEEKRNSSTPDEIRQRAGVPHQRVSPPVETVPAPPIEVGAVVARVGSIGRWVVEAIAGTTAKVKQLGGWGFGEFSIAELEPLRAV